MRLALALLSVVSAWAQIFPGPNSPYPHSGGGVTPTLVQTRSHINVAPGTTVAVTLSTPVTSGNTIAAGVLDSQNGGTPLLTSCTDDKANAYTVAKTQASTNAAASVGFAFFPAATNGPVTITCTNSSSTYSVIIVQEWRLQNNALDGTGQGAQDAGGTAPYTFNAASLTTTNAADAVLTLFVSNYGGTSQAISIASPFTFNAACTAGTTDSTAPCNNNGGNSSAGGMASDVTTSTGTYIPSFTASNNSFPLASITVALK